MKIYRLRFLFKKIKFLFEKIVKVNTIVKSLYHSVMLNYFSMLVVDKLHIVNSKLLAKF